jgi:hypothetical protein
MPLLAFPCHFHAQASNFTDGWMLYQQVAKEEENQPHRRHNDGISFISTLSAVLGGLLTAALPCW